MDFDRTGSQKAFAAFLAQDRRTALCTKALITAWPSVTVEADECGSTPPVGLRDCDTLSMTLEDIGKELGVSKERIRQIEGKALRKLRNPGVTRLLGEPREPPYVHFVDSDAELVHSREADAPQRFGYWRRVALLIWKYCGMYQWQYADARGVSIAASPLIYYTEASAISHGLLGRHGGP